MAIAKFEKVSYKQFKEDWLKNSPVKGKTESDWTDEEIMKLYDSIQLPKRATKGSAGYDFKSYFDYTLEPGETILIPTGIRCIINYDWFLAILPRSGHGFKYRIQLDNTVGVIDADYSESKNEGHIMVKMTNDSKTNKTLSLTTQDGFAQGIFLRYGLAEEDAVVTQRNGGFGSTSVK